MARVHPFKKSLGGQQKRYGALDASVSFGESDYEVGGKFMPLCDAPCHYNR
jgi:hypothetical protein